MVQNSLPRAVRPGTVTAVNYRDLGGFAKRSVSRGRWGWSGGCSRNGSPLPPSDTRWPAAFVSPVGAASWAYAEWHRAGGSWRFGAPHLFWHWEARREQVTIQIHLASSLRSRVLKWKPWRSSIKRHTQTCLPSGENRRSDHPLSQALPRQLVLTTIPWGTCYFLSPDVVGETEARTQEMCIKSHIWERESQDSSQSGQFQTRALTSKLHGLLQIMTRKMMRKRGDHASLCEGLCLLRFVYSASATPVAHGFIPVSQLYTMRIREATWFAQGPWGRGAELLPGIKPKSAQLQSPCFLKCNGVAPSDHSVAVTIERSKTFRNPQVPKPHQSNTRGSRWMPQSLAEEKQMALAEQEWVCKYKTVFPHEARF